ncbi:hypothetical protein OCF65_18905 [Bacillus toyonensis]|uniref:hypothetical protein n=1 Tax=Bacillus cereus group TaxID=86661 RepID=UPI0010BCF164|nr:MULTISPECIES: hypothetical protein [Bacillus cereus group]MCU5582507.1 hypothetical protein [Bacillus toyonensis]TKH75985.1 hypothetical protein FC688_22945 [Bacillus cereus]
MEERNWTDKDWKWLMGILVGIIILILSLWFADYKGIEANFSIMSSAVSIALGLVAIYIALKQDSDSQRLNQQMQDILRTMESKIDKVDQKVNKLDDFDVEKTLTENLNPVIEQIVQTVEQKNKNISKQDIQQVFEEAVPYVAKNMSEQLNSDISDSYKKKLSHKNSAKKKILSILEDENEGLTVKDVQRKLVENGEYMLSTVFLHTCMEQLVRDGKMVKERNYEKQGMIYRIAEKPYTY